MTEIKMAVLGTGTGTDALTRKEGTDGLTVRFEGEQAFFLSWRSFRQILNLRTAGPKTEARPMAAAQTVGVGPGSSVTK